MPAARSFLSDNASSVHPKVLDAIARANAGHASAAYGDDEYSRGVAQRLADLVGGVEAFFVFNGTGANVLGLSTILRRHEAVVCAAGAHIAVDECGAPERFAAAKLLTVATGDGKLRPRDVEAHLARVGDQHAVQPRVVSITNATEAGTVYTPDEVRALSAYCRGHGLRLHVDGARIANAAAAGHDVRALCEGVDVLSFGGTKNGALAAEAVVLFDAELARDFKFVRKQGMQLASKMRYVAAQFDALLTDHLWLDNARHANRIAALLAQEAARVPGVALTRAPEANAVFARMPRAAIAPLQSEWPFYVWDEGNDEVRWVASFDTTEDDMLAFADALRRCVARAGDKKA